MGRLEDIAARNRPSNSGRSLPPGQMKWVFIGIGAVIVVILVGGLVSTLNERAATEREQETPSQPTSPPAPAPAPSLSAPSGSGAARHVITTNCDVMRNELTPLEERLLTMDPTAGRYCEQLRDIAKVASQTANRYTPVLKHALALSRLGKQCDRVGVATTDTGVRAAAEEIAIAVAAECAGQ